MNKFLVFLCTAAFATEAYSNGKTSLFPEPNCNVASAVKSLRERSASPVIEPLGGDLPWPGVIGKWTNQTRGIYLEVRTIESRKGTTWIDVEVRSLCGGGTLASGLRAVKASDWDISTLKIQVVNYGLGSNNEKLLLSIRATKNVGNTNFLDVKIESEKSSSKGTLKETMDRFIGSKL